MKTVQLDIQDDKLSIFLTIINSLKSGIVEEIEKDSDDYLILQQAKKENNQKYDIGEAKARLGLWIKSYR